MTQAAVHSPSRPFNPWLFLALPLGLAALLLAFEPVTLDLALANLMYDPGAGFIGRHSWFLENILHDRVKQLVIAISVLGLLVSIAGLFHRPWRALSRPLAYVFLAMSLAASIVTPLKALTAVQCPWSLAQFGGEETYSSLLSPRPPTEHPGRCWPGGHASSGFVLFALFFALRDRKPRLARYALAFAFAMGCLLSLSRMLQGAHFLSHNLWTMLFDWLICLGLYRLMLYRPEKRGQRNGGADETAFRETVRPLPARRTRWAPSCRTAAHRLADRLEQPFCLLGIDRHEDFLRLVGQLEEMHRMQPAALAEAFAGSQRGGTAHAQAARLLQQPVADRLALVAAPLLGDEGQLIALHGRSSRCAICPASSSSRTTPAESSATSR